MNKVRLISIAFLFLYFAESVQAEYELEHDPWKLELLPKSKCKSCASGFSHSIKVSNVATGTEEVVSGFKDAKTIDYIDVFEGLIVVRGSLSSGGERVSILNLETLEVMDTFRAYKVDRSPSGRYLVFQKFVPRSLLGKLDDTLMVIDLSKLASDYAASFADQSVRSGIGNDYKEISSFASELYSQKASKISGAFSLIDRRVIWEQGEREAYFFTYDYEGYVSIVKVINFDNDPVAECKQRLINRSISEQSEGERFIKYTIEKISRMKDNDSVLLVEFYNQSVVKLSIKLWLKEICK